MKQQLIPRKVMCSNIFAIVFHLGAYIVIGSYVGSKVSKNGKKVGLMIVVLVTAVISMALVSPTMAWEPDFP